MILQAIGEALDERILKAAVEKALERLRSDQERTLDHRTAIAFRSEGVEIWS